VSDAVYSQVDLVASLAELVGVPLPAGIGYDSVDRLSTLLGQNETDRPHVLQQGAGADFYGIRKGDWKLIPASPRPAFAVMKHNSKTNPLTTPMPAANIDYLYNLAIDPSESTNLAAEHPEIVAELKALLERVKAGSDRDVLGTSVQR
jgi:arylsulfatase A-like enzyme